MPPSLWACVDLSGFLSPSDGRGCYLVLMPHGLHTSSPASRKKALAAVLLFLLLALGLYARKLAPEAAPTAPPPLQHEASTPMADEELLAKTLSVAREAGLLVLRRSGTVPPFGLTLDPAGNDPRSFFPRDQMPQASSEELLTATVSHLEQRSRIADVGALALVTSLESEAGASGLGIQVETRASSLFLVYPATQSAQGRSLGEPRSAQELLVGPLLHNPSR